MRLINFRGYFINPNGISYISDVFVKVNFPKIWAFTIYFMSDKKLEIEIYKDDEEEIKKIRMDLFDLINTREIW